MAQLKKMRYVQQHPAQKESISGSVERVTFHNAENGFCVLRIKARGQRDLITLIGHIATIHPGEHIEVEGAWITNKKHGLQFKAQSLQTIQPTTLDGIEKYLGSGMVKGIGPHFAKKLVRAFKERVFDVIENDPEKLQSLSGIGQKRTQQITEAWNTQKVIRDIMIFLQSHGVGTARAVRIYKTYGDAAINTVQENPYRLATDIRGIGFKTADVIAQNLGIAPDALIRIQAGVQHVLQEETQSGHCAAYRETLIEKTMALLEVPQSLVETAIAEETKAEHLVTESIGAKQIVYLAALHQVETSVAQQFHRLLQGAPPWGAIYADKAIPWVEQKTQLTLSASQKTAIATVLHSKVSIITGGPGVGKTTLVNSLLKIIRAKQCTVALCAPTGRAAKRLTETTGLPAKTVHRLLEIDPKTFSFKRNQNWPLEADLIVIDEASMLDIVLMHHLLKAIPDRAALLLVGDVDQLPSVGPGAVLSHCIASEVIPTIQLTEIFRQSAHSHIITNAHRINQGHMPKPPVPEQATDFYMIPADTPEEIYDKLLQVVTERIPQRFGYNPIHDIQVLTPMHRGGIGTRNLNIALQKNLNPHIEASISRFGWTFAQGDKVIQNVNNYDKEVFNGDIGHIQRINVVDQELCIYFDGTPKIYEFGELDEIALAYAISIHKSQGSEYPAVVIPLSTQHYPMLAKNLLYTAVTRGKKLVVLIGQPKAIAIAVRNAKALQRLSYLKERLGY